MKSFPAHIAALASEFQDELQATTPEAALPEAIHPLAAQLRHALENPRITNLGTYAKLVDQIMGELSLMSSQTHVLTQPGTSPGNARGPARAPLPMPEEDEAKIVEYFLSRQRGPAS
jgi:hypothetical protein